ncbi:MAG: anti-sigma factor antagonist [Candidatus Eisenbacteria bacterium]|nr:anti-sigma factor antagonist [Candidatus Eisenbacteria bacterium]
MKVKTQMEGDVAVVHVSGKLMGGPESDQLRNEVKRLIDEGTNKFVIDLHGVPWINSTGLGALMSVYTSVQRSEGSLKLCNVSDRIQSLFMITKLLTIFDTYPSEKDAVGAFK